MDSFAYLLISKLKNSYVIDYEKSDKPFCSVFTLNGNTDNRFFEYFLRQAARPPKELEEKHKKLGVDEFGYFFIEIDFRNQIARDIFEKIVTKIEKTRLTGNIYNCVTIDGDIEEFTMSCSTNDPFIRNVSGRFLKLEGEHYSIQPCLDSMFYWHVKDEEDTRSGISKFSEKIKKLFLSQSEYRKIKETVIDVYTHTQKKGVGSFFDKKGKLIQANIVELRSSYSSMFLAKHNSAISQITLASFGFSDPNAIICAGFLKIINTNYDINDRHNWDDYDLWLHVALKESATFGDVLFTLNWERYWNSTPLLQFASLREIIPEGFYMPSSCRSYTDIEFKEKEFRNLNDPSDIYGGLWSYVRSFREDYGWKKERGQTIEEYVMDCKNLH